mgnify:CR=1 FL=1
MARFARIPTVLRLLLIVLILSGCVTAQPAAPPVVAAAPFSRAAAYSGARNEHGLLIMRNGQTLYERYNDGFDENTPHRLASGTKSFSCVMAIAAVEDGLLQLDKPVAKTITEWQGHPLKAQITIRQLLSLTSGIEPGRRGFGPTYAGAIKAEAIHAPGTTFAYGPTPFQVFGEVMRRKLASREESPLDYLKRRIFSSIGLEVGNWKFKDGNPNMPAGAFLTAREWAKFGMFINNGGRWNGKQVVDENLLNQCFQGSTANPYYGTTFWLNAFAKFPEDARKIKPGELHHASVAKHRLIYAAGHGKQRLYMLPDLGLVIVRFGESEFYGWNDAEFLDALLADIAEQGNATQDRITADDKEE